MSSMGWKNSISGLKKSREKNPTKETESKLRTKQLEKVTEAARTFKCRCSTTRRCWKYKFKNLTEFLELNFHHGD